MTRRHAGALERRVGRPHGMTRDVLIGDDKSFGARPQRRKPRPKRADDAASDRDLVAARPKRDRDDDAVAAHRCRHY